METGGGSRRSINSLDMGIKACNPALLDRAGLCALTVNINFHLRMAMKTPEQEIDYCPNCGQTHQIGFDCGKQQTEYGQCDMCGKNDNLSLIYNMYNGEEMLVCEKCLIAHNKRIF